MCKPCGYGVALLLLGATLAICADPVAARLAKEARRAENQGQLVRAYMLFAEAAARDPKNVSYAVSRDAVEPLAKLLSKSDVETANIKPEIAEAEAYSNLTSLPLIAPVPLDSGPVLLPPAVIRPSATLQSFDLHADEKSVIRQVAQAFGIEAVFDPDFTSKPDVHFNMTGVPFRTALDGVTDATNTFVFALSERQVFVARDTDVKRNEFEPQIVLTVDLPESIDPKEIVEAASAARGAAQLRGAITWDSQAHKVVIHDRVTRARVARSLMEAILLPKAQVSFEVQVMIVDSDSVYKYGVSWQTLYQMIPLGAISKIHNASLPSILNTSTFLPFGGGASLIGIGLADANLMASYSNSYARALYDATVVVADGQTATLHVGDKYPIPSALYKGVGQTGASSGALNPIGQVTQEDLGLALKIGARVHGDGEIALDLDAEFKSLGTTQLDSVPSVNQRAFKSSLTLNEGQWAIIGGMQEDARSANDSGFPALGAIPGLEALFTQTTREHRKSDTLVVIKPTITRLPMSAEISPQFLLGPEHGQRVLF